MGEFVMELWAFMKERKKFWLLPIILVLLMLGTLIVLTQVSAVAPFRSREPRGGPREASPRRNGARNASSSLVGASSMVLA